MFVCIRKGSAGRKAWVVLMILDSGEAREWVRKNTAHCRADKDSLGNFLMQKEVENTRLQTAIGGEWEYFSWEVFFFCSCKYIRNQYKF